VSGLRQPARGRSPLADEGRPSRAQRVAVADPAVKLEAEESASRAPIGGDDQVTSSSQPGHASEAARDGASPSARMTARLVRSPRHAAKAPTQLATGRRPQWPGCLELAALAEDRLGPIPRAPSGGPSACRRRIADVDDVRRPAAEARARRGPEKRRGVGRRRAFVTADPDREECAKPCLGWCSTTAIASGHGAHREARHTQAGQASARRKAAASPISAVGAQPAAAGGFDVRVGHQAPVSR
jgi:hypothetical protein